MSTSFYLTDAVIFENLPTAHIGKRSGAGLYCFDCDLTLSKNGKERLHDSPNLGRYDACLGCGAAPDRNATILTDMRPSGVARTCSFSWAQDPEIIGPLIMQYPLEPLVRDEYGGIWTGQGFLDMLASSCPIQYTDSIGLEFS